MVPIEERLACRTNYGGRRTQKIEWLVMHYTANDGDSARGNAAYFQQPLSPAASAHYFVDDIRITRSVPEDHVAYHCGASSYRHPVCRNGNSIGIELCDARRDGQVMATDKTLANAAALAAELCGKYGIPAEHIIRHYDVTGKLCPRYWVDDPEGFRRFREAVKEELEMISKVTMLVDGKKVEVERILKNGVNYVKIRDLAAALQLEVGNHGNIPVLSRKE